MSGEGVRGGASGGCEWSVRVERVLMEGASFQSGGWVRSGCFRVKGASEWVRNFRVEGVRGGCEWRVRAHTGMRDHTLTRTRGRRRTSTANATAAAYRRACQKAAYAIRISSTDSPRKLNVDVALRLSQARGGEPPPIFGMRIL